MQAQSDEQLMAMLAAGETAALETLVQRYHRMLLGYLYRFVGGDRSLAEDLVQETFLRVLRQQHNTMPQSFKAWLYAIATNLARDHLRSADCRHMVDVPEEAWLAFRDPSPDPEKLVLAAEQERLLVAALGQISAEYRAALLLRYFNGLSLHEIAEALHIPLGTVKSRLSTGLRHLRPIITQKQVGVATHGTD
jgi:RNA polymerase sigma-70 factor, ECF subfamily